MPVISAFCSAESGVRITWGSFGPDCLFFALAGVREVLLVEVERLVRGFVVVLVLLERGLFLRAEGFLLVDFFFFVGPVAINTPE